MLAGGGTYYTFVDSGAFTVQYASFTDMDESGIELNGTGPFSINNSTFDYNGNGIVSTSTLFTLTGVTQSTITLVGVIYGNSRLNGTNYNYTILGSSAGLKWANQQFTGALTGDAHEQNDTANFITWAPSGCATFTSVANSSWSLPTTWNSGIVPTACNPVVIAAGTNVTLDISSATASTTTINGTLYFTRIANSSFTVVGGSVSVNAGGTLDMGSSGNPINASTAVLVLAFGKSAGQYGLQINTGGSFLAWGNPKTIAHRLA